MSGPEPAKRILIRVEMRPAKTYILECPECGNVFASRKNKAKFCSLECSRANYKTKPRERTCKECGQTFSVIINTSGAYPIRATCSVSCERIQRRKNNDYSDKARRAKLSAAALRNNAVAQIHTPAVRAIATTHAGLTRRGTPACGDAALGKPHTERLHIMLTPNGERYTTRCVRHFVRTHPHLFNECDLIRRRQNTDAKSTIEGNMTCNAMGGLAEVCRGKRNSWKDWKGWTVTP